MVAPRKTRKIVCTVVRTEETGPGANRLSRPSDLLPWADPYIVQLVQNLQEEIRNERLNSRRNWEALNPIRNDLEPPSPATDSDWSEFDEPRWTFREQSPN